MIALLFGWLYLFILSAGLGGWFLQALHPPAALGMAARFFLSMWMGLLGWGSLLLIMALLGPLSPVVAGICLFLSLALLLHPANPIRPICLHLIRTPRWLLGGGLLALALLPVCLQPVTNSDSVSYHYDLIALLSRLGTVPGLALVHVRFAFISAWFTFPALLNHGPFEARLTGVGGGFAALLAAGHIYWVSAAFLQGRSTPVDRFIGLGLLLTIFFPTLLNITATPAHDYPTQIIILLTAWTLLLTGPTFLGRWRYLPIVFASFAITLKLSALPVLAIVGLAGLVRVPDKLRYGLISAILGSLIILPWMTNQIIISGWPLFPLGIGLPLPWSLPVEAKHYVVNAIQSYYSPWPIVAEEGFLSGLKYWLTHDHTHPFAGVLVIITLAAIPLLFAKRKSLPKGLLPLIVLGGLGSLFQMWTTAHPRYGWGYLAILPAGLVLLNLGIPRRLHLSRIAADSLAWTAVVLLLAVPTMVLPSRTEKMLQLATEQSLFPPVEILPLWRPPLVPTIKYPDKFGAAENYQYPVIEKDLLVMKARPMFFKIDLQHTLELRNPDKGIRSGFIPKSLPDN